MCEKESVCVRERERVSVRERESVSARVSEGERRVCVREGGGERELRGGGGKDHSSAAADTRTMVVKGNRGKETCTRRGVL